MKKMYVTILLGKEEEDSPIEIIGVYAREEDANKVFSDLVEDGNYYDIWGEKELVIR